jgi:polyhydroxybutyrate depolymerase
MRMVRKKILFVLQFIFIFTSVSVYADDSTPICQPGSICSQSIVVKGLSRTFTYYLPKTYARNQRYYNLVIALHGAGKTGEFLEKNILRGNLDVVALQSRSIIVYPDALNGNWNYGAGSTANNDDIAFIDGLIQYFKTNYFINPFRIYVAGFSEGGFLAFRLACERADLITAIATVASAMPTVVAENCKPSRHISILMMNGKDDPLLPWDGHEITSVTGAKQGNRLSVPETYRAWLDINDIHAPAYQQPVPNAQFDGTWIWTTTAQGGGAVVILYTIYKGGHTWPGGAQYLPERYIGNTSSFDASGIIWHFFISKRLQPLIVPSFHGWGWGAGWH